MAVRVDIFNSALGHIGSGTVLASAEEPGGVANELRRHYPIARNAMFAEFPWSWARRVTEAVAYDTPPPGFAYAYQVPAGCAEVRKLTQTTDDAAAALNFRLGGVTSAEGVDLTLILSQDQALYVTWTRIVTNEALWPAPFVHALSWRLAWLAGSAIARDAFRRDECMKQAGYWFQVAASHDQRQGHENPRDADAIRGRV